MIIHIIHTALSLATIYGSYIITTEYLTYEYNNAGVLSYILIFLLNIISSILAPFIVYYGLGVKWSIVLGTFTYICWLVLFNMNNNICLLIGSIFVGLGASLVRSQQNVWIVSFLDTNNNIGFYIGLYNAFFSVNGIIGASFSILVLYLNYSLEILIWILFILSIISFFFLLFIKPVALNETHKIDLKSYFNLAKDIRLLLLLPLLMYQSMAIVFSYEIYPLLINDKLHIAYMFLLYSILYCIITYVLGYLSKYDEIFILLLNIVCGLILFGIYWIYEYSIYLIGSLNGINDGIINYVIVYVLSKYFSSKAVYSVSRSYMCFFSALFSALCQVMTFYGVLFLMNIILLIGVLAFIYLRYKTDINKITDIV